MRINENQLEAALKLFNQAAREHSCFMVERVFRDELTGELVKNDPLHDEWHALADEFDRLIIMAFPESGKTTSIVVGRALWELGTSHDLRMLVLSKTFSQAVSITRTVRQLIDENDVVHELFPDLRPGAKWTDGEFVVQRKLVSRSPSMKAVGRESSFMGLRTDRLYIDDLEDDKNTRTPRDRAETIRFLDKNCFNRLTKIARIVWVSNDWHPKAACQQVGQRRRWQLRKYAICSKVDDAPLFPTKFPSSRIEAIKKDMHPLLFAQLYRNESRDESSGQFKQEYIDRCKENGRGLEMVYSMTADELPPGSFIACGVDLATGRKQTRKSDKTVFTVALCRPNLQRRLLWVESGILSGPEILFKMSDLHRRYHDVSCMVEDNGAQIYLMQFAELLSEEGLQLPPIYPQTTTSVNKWSHAFGVASIAVEMQRGMWTYPCEGPGPRCDVDLLRCSDDVEQLCQDELDFTADGSHTGDHLMSKWLCRELIRTFMPSAHVPDGSLDEDLSQSHMHTRGGGF